MKINWAIVNNHNIEYPTPTQGGAAAMFVEVEASNFAQDFLNTICSSGTNFMAIAPMVWQWHPFKVNSHIVEYPTPGGGSRHVCWVRDLNFGTELSEYHMQLWCKFHGNRSNGLAVAPFWLHDARFEHWILKLGKTGVNQYRDIRAL